MKPPRLVNVTLPVFNEERRLARSLPRLHAFLAAQCRFPFELVIADNGSTDGTPTLARQLAAAHPGTRVEHLDQRGRGRALKHVWRDSAADILSYMDVDLSTDLAAFPPLLAALVDGGHDVAVGSRLLQASRTRRSLKRELLSRGYNRLVRWLFGTRLSDAQCGFKALTREAFTRLLPHLTDDGWFLDTELLVWAEHLGLRVHELPVCWEEDADSRVRLVRTMWMDLLGLARLRRAIGAEGRPRKNSTETDGQA